jgi:hypothetical protein
MTDLTTAVLTRVYDALTAGMSVPVYTHPPADASMPYCVIDSVQAVPFEQFERRRETVNVFISVWTAYEGVAKALELLEEVRTALDHLRDTQLASGHTLTRAYVRSRSTSRDIEPQTHKGEASVRIHARR